MKYILLILAALVISSPAYALKYTETVDDNETVCFTPKIKAGKDAWSGTVVAYGTWGSGTITWKLKSGSSYIELKDLTASTVTSTADDNFQVTLGKASYGSTDLDLCAVMAGATTPSLTIELYDNN